jgi:hypothetical protein
VTGAAAIAKAPALRFTVEDARTEPFAAVPTLSFTLALACAGGAAIRAVALDVQLRIAAARRRYDAAAQARLVELFGAPAEWSRSLQSLLWTHATVQVPPFTGTTRVALPVACTYDLEVAAAKYFQALEDGDVPLEFLFSGSVFDVGEAGGLRVRRIPWDAEAEFRLPVRLWRETMDRHFPGSAWLRLRHDAYARLVAYKARHALPTWEHAIEALLDAAEGR